MKTIVLSLMLFSPIHIIMGRAIEKTSLEIVETNSDGIKLGKVDMLPSGKTESTIKLLTDEKCQSIVGFGGAFTQATAYLLNQLSDTNKEKVINAYFSKQGAAYSLTRAHINSCDFSLSNYCYVDDNDTELKSFSIECDKKDIIPIIKEAFKVSDGSFKIISSAWTAPPWMKDNKSWVGGKLLPEYKDTWSQYIAKYLSAYKQEGIDIWGITVINEPNGNGNNWESMHFTPDEMTEFVVNHLGPGLNAAGFGEVKILGYDQNRMELPRWVDSMYRDKESCEYFDGCAIHWYDSTFDYFPNELQYAHNKAPEKYLIQTEACIDADTPHWNDDKWYWSKEATDWGWDWAPEEQKYLHPQYTPAFRYARDIIGCLNNWVNGWIDWNMVLDKQGGPNWFKNWCVAPVIVDAEKDEIYFTPLFYVMTHFSRYIRPEAVIIKTEVEDDELMATAAINEDGSIATVVFNSTEKEKVYCLQVNTETYNIKISPKAIQTIVINQK